MEGEEAQRFLNGTPRFGCGGNLGRQGSSALGSWENTESSPEEQVELRVSGKFGENWSRDKDRSRYSLNDKAQSCIYI